MKSSTFWPSTILGATSLAWLGQAGFAIQRGNLRLLIDPYLSDALAKKYRGTATPHERLMAPPVTVQLLSELDFVLCSHRHSDHMDPETLPTLANSAAACRFIVPRADLKHAKALGIPGDRIVPIDAGERFALNDESWIEAIPAAHETLEMDAQGHCHFLGYILHLGGATLYHSGDTVMYPGLLENLLPRQIEVALLPVNGRGKGVPGNFTFEEAVGVCLAASISNLVPHHFGMFSFNTENRNNLISKSAATVKPRCFLPECGSWFHFKGGEITV